MIVLSGQGFGLRSVLGRAAHLKVEKGRPTLTEETLAFLIERRRLEDGEIRLVLIAEDPLYALWMPLPGDAVLVGVVSENAPEKPLNATDLAIVCEAEGARQMIDEGHMLLLDPAQGRVLVEPSAEEVLRVASGHRPRYLIGAAHAPAYTRSGVRIGVWARALTPDDAQTAADGGAEGLWFDAPADLETLTLAAQTIGGGALAVDADTETLAALGRRAQVFQLSTEPATALRSAWSDAVRAAALAGESIDPPTLIARLPADPADYDRALHVNGPLPEDIFALPPLWVAVETPEEAQRAALAGAVGVVCPPEIVADVKHALREVD